MKRYTIIVSTTILLIASTLAYSKEPPTSQAFHEILKQQGLDEKMRTTLEALFQQHQLALTKDEFGNPTIINKSDKQGSYSIKVERRQPDNAITHYLDQDYNDRLSKLEQDIKHLQDTIDKVSKQLSQLKNK